MVHGTILGLFWERAFCLAVGEKPANKDTYLLKEENITFARLFIEKLSGMKSGETPRVADTDPTAESRKADHIELAFKAQVQASLLDTRFHYEPFTAAHPAEQAIPATAFGAKSLKIPVWVSSMTGGTKMARTINHNLARACREFGMGMGLGSCRSLLSSDDMLADFNVRSIIGDDLPLYANLGIAQVEMLLDSGKDGLMQELVDKLQADGLIIHVNPLQEWMQPEGDTIQRPPLETIKRVLDKAGFGVIVKEVGQGFGPVSMKELLSLPLDAIEFAANGGTNFALLELMRSDSLRRNAYESITRVGHDAWEMLDMVRKIKEGGHSVKARQLIVSGGIGTFLDGYYAVRTSPMSAVYGQASRFLAYAREDYESLHQYLTLQQKGLALAYTYLHPKISTSTTHNH
jgi:isopentenyl-diphosphate Delta-isomerase